MLFVRVSRYEQHPWQGNNRPKARDSVRNEEKWKIGKDDRNWYLWPDTPSTTKSLEKGKGNIIRNCLRAAYKFLAFEMQPKIRVRGKRCLKRFPSPSAFKWLWFSFLLNWLESCEDEREIKITCVPLMMLKHHHHQGSWEMMKKTTMSLSLDTSNTWSGFSFCTQSLLKLKEEQHPDETSLYHRIRHCIFKFLSPPLTSSLSCNNFTSSQEKQIDLKEHHQVLGSFCSSKAPLSFSGFLIFIFSWIEKKKVKYFYLKCVFFWSYDICNLQE